jgi:hypothetical protein
MKQKMLAGKNPAPRLRVAKDKIGPDGQHYATFEEFISDAMATTGTRNEDLAHTLLIQLANAQGLVSENTENAINAALASLAEFKCGNIQEAMLAINIIELYSHSTKLFIKAANAMHPELQLNFLHMAIKLSRAFTLGIEAFQKLRRGGAYTMNIRHLHVQPGAQAIVGNVNQAERNQ